MRHEWARKLDDLLFRRSGWIYYDRLSAAQIEQIARWMGEAANWSPARREAELAAWRRAAALASAA